jgi:hypothetical protein
MKRILSFFTVAAIVTACNNTSETELANAKLQAYKDSVRTAADTAGLSEFQAWKSQNELSNVREYQAATLAAPAITKTVAYTPKRATTSRASSSSRNVSQSGSMSSQSSNTAMRKKGWSKAAKGAAIGTASGAVIGAVVNKKNRVAGGVVGGVIGAAGGYGIGRGMDKRDGRY